MFIGCIFQPALRCCLTCTKYLITISLLVADCHQVGLRSQKIWLRHRKLDWTHRSCRQRYSDYSHSWQPRKQKSPLYYFPLIFLVFLQLNMLARVWAFYLWRNSCSKKFQSRKKVHILWVGLFFSSHSLRKNNSWATTQSELILWHNQFIQITTKITSLLFFLLTFMTSQRKL